MVWLSPAHNVLGIVKKLFYPSAALIYTSHCLFAVYATAVTSGLILQGSEQVLVGQLARSCRILRGRAFHRMDRSVFTLKSRCIGMVIAQNVQPSCLSHVR